jgi:hypothetical protein
MTETINPARLKFLRKLAIELKIIRTEAQAKRLLGTVEGALELIKIVARQRKGVITQLIIQNRLPEWDVGLQLKYGENSGGIYGEIRNSLPEALILTAFRAKGWTDENED